MDRKIATLLRLIDEIVRRDLNQPSLTQVSPGVVEAFDLVLRRIVEHGRGAPWVDELDSRVRGLLAQREASSS